MENHTPRPVVGGPLRPTAIASIDESSYLARHPQTPPASAPAVPAISGAAGSRPPPAAEPSQQKRPRKERQPNWQAEEVILLIRAKRDLHFQELDTADARDLMVPDNTKWTRVSNLVMAAGLSRCVRDAAACKTKWNQLLPDYKRVADYLGRSGQNVKDYWDLTSPERKANNLPGQFPREFFDALDEWFGARPQMRPPHVRDTLCPTDSNFADSEKQSEEGVQAGDAETDSEDPLELDNAGLAQTTEFARPPKSPALRSARSSPLSSRSSTPVGTAFRTVAAAASPILLSSSATTANLPGRPGNTGIRRKNVSGHTVIADATKATGAIMASQMKDIADASLQVERTKIDVQMRLFSEQMAYQRERDMRLHETAIQAQENARLAILKQTEMVSCLSQLTNVLGHTWAGNASTVQATEIGRPRSPPPAAATTGTPTAAPENRANPFTHRQVEENGFYHSPDPMSPN